MANTLILAQDIASQQITDFHISPSASISASKINTSGATNVVSQVSAGANIIVSGGDGSGHGSITIQATNQDIIEYRNNFVATPGQTVFTTTSAYVMGYKNLKVFVNGAIQTPTTHYTEVNNTNILFGSGMSGGELVSLVWALGNGSSNTMAVNGISASATPQPNQLLALGSGAQFDSNAIADNFEVGDTKWRMCPTASGKWLLMNGGTIGNAGSGASLRANADTYNLFEFLYNNVSDTYAPVSGGRTGNVLNDFNSLKTIVIPPMDSMVQVGFSGGEAEFNVLGKNAGAKTHQLSVGELASHGHTVSGGNHSSHTASVFGNHGSGGSGGAGFLLGDNGVNVWQSAVIGGDGAHSHSADANGSNTPHNNLQPYRVGYFFIRY